MPDPGYIATALAVAVGITVTLRALPFAIERAMEGTALLANIGRWLPLDAIAILTAYYLSDIDVIAAGHGVAELVGVAVTVAVHLWCRNAVLNIVAGTAACLLLTNWALSP